MAIKGNAYLKTTWAFGERPVTSAKLNQWDDRIEAALELLYHFLAHAWGGGNGIIRGAATHDAKVVATTPASRAVAVRPGYAFISKLPFRLTATTPTPEVTPPTVHPRIDLVQARLDTWGVSIKTGAETPTPVAPTPDPDCLPLAHLYLRPTMTTIKDTDDTINAYIIDTRPFL